jgi:methyl-accepting chemotaxis protein
MPEDVFRRVITIGVFLTVIAFVVEAALIFAVYRMAKVTQDKVLRVVNAVTLVIGTIGRFADENSPKFSQIATDATEGAKSLQEQANRLGEVAKDLTARLHAKVVRIDGAMDQTVQQLHQAGDLVKQTILTPVKQVGGIMLGVRAALSVLSHSRRESVDAATQDEEIFP